MAQRVHHYARAQITRNPKVLGGKPVIAGTRISVEFILELLASGMTQAGIASEYNLSAAKVCAAVRYAAGDIKRTDVLPYAA